VPDAAALVDDLVARLRPLDIELAEAWWQASTDVSEASNARRVAADVARRELLADADAFAALDAARTEGTDDPLLRRQLELLHPTFRSQQIPADLRVRLAELEAGVDAAFNEHRGEIDGQAVDDNEILRILHSSDDEHERRAAWEASKQVGAVVAEWVRELARMRNEAARALGFRDHFAATLELSELDETRLLATFDEVDVATAMPFAAWKANTDAALADRFGLDGPAAVRPWHYDDPFLQEPPATGGVDLNPLFADADLTALTLRTYEGLGLNVREVVAHSDLKPRERKSQHAFCLDVDHEGDVRVLANVEANERWADTMLHEFGHAIYDVECAPDLPWLLRTAAHPLTTEGIAMLLGRLARDAEWLGSVLEVEPSVLDELAPRLEAGRRAARLCFARWVLVMTNFERELYADPDANIDALWWELVERFQLVRKPEGRSNPDWAAKIHVAVAPVYYQNYLYGELVASQLARALRDRHGGLVDRPAAGAYLRDQVFRPGARWRWDELMVRATGEPLTARHLAAELAT